MRESSASSPSEARADRAGSLPHRAILLPVQKEDAMFKTAVTAVALTIALSGSALARSVCSDVGCKNINSVWLLQSLHGAMGPTYTINGIEAFDSEAQCRVALDKRVARYIGRSHAEGGYDYYRCTQWEGGVGNQ
jgi:hypothetical protein